MSVFVEMADYELCACTAPNDPGAWQSQRVVVSFGGTSGGSNPAPPRLTSQFGSQRNGQWRVVANAGLTVSTLTQSYGIKRFQLHWYIDPVARHPSVACVDSIVIGSCGTDSSPVGPGPTAIAPILSNVLNDGLWFSLICPTNV